MTSSVIHGTKNGPFGNDMSEPKKTFQLIRFALSGAVMGVALAGIIASLLGYHDGNIQDVLGATFGFVAVIIFKILHVF